MFHPYPKAKTFKIHSCLSVLVTMQIKAQRRYCFWVSGNNWGNVRNKKFKQNERRRVLIKKIPPSMKQAKLEKNDEREKNVSSFPFWGPLWFPESPKGGIVSVGGCLQERVVVRETGEWVLRLRLVMTFSPSFLNQDLLGLCLDIQHIFLPLQCVKSALTRTVAS